MMIKYGRIGMVSTASHLTDLKGDSESRIYTHRWVSWALHSCFDIDMPYDFLKSALGRRGILNLTVGSGEGGECKKGMQASACSPMEKVPQLWGHASFLLSI